MNDYERDKRWMLKKRAEVLAPRFYDVRWPGRYRFTEEGSSWQAIGVDTIVYGRDDEERWFEEKFMRIPHTVERFDNVIIELQSCTNPGMESPGWWYYCQAHFLLFFFAQRDGAHDVWLMDLPQLRIWVKPILMTLEEFGPLPRIPRTYGRKLPLAMLERWKRSGVLDLWKVTI